MTVTITTKHTATKTDDNDNETCCSDKDCDPVDAVVKDLVQTVCAQEDQINAKKTKKEGCEGIYHEQSRHVLTYEEAPDFIKHNPYILSGYRGPLQSQLCLASLFWWSNETVNIWSHAFGFFLFLFAGIRDVLTFDVYVYFFDKFMVAFVLICFMICMVLSALYHTFSCRSARTCEVFLSYDLFGISLSLFAIYTSGVYYAFWCEQELMLFYLFTVTLIFAVAMSLHVPAFGISTNVKMIVFVLWAAYGILPTFHWTIMKGGFENPLVELLLPKVIGMYGWAGSAFFFYMTKIPERFRSGAFDYLGHSHQWWHVLIVATLYYWHCTGMVYLEYRFNHYCVDDVS